MESFLVGDSSHQVRRFLVIFFKLYLKFLQVFFEIQTEAAKCLENHFDEFKATQMFEEMRDSKEDEVSETFRDRNKVGSDDRTEVTEMEQSSARSQLENVQKLLQNKLQAQEALQISLKPDSKVLQNIQEEIQSLESEKTELQLHIEQTDSWTDNLGVWQCSHWSILLKIYSYWSILLILCSDWSGVWQCRVHGVAGLASRDTLQVRLHVCIIIIINLINTNFFTKMIVSNFYFLSIYFE